MKTHTYTHTCWEQYKVQTLANYRVEWALTIGLHRNTSWHVELWMSWVVNTWEELDQGMLNTHTHFHTCTVYTLCTHTGSADFYKQRRSCVTLDSTLQLWPSITSKTHEREAHMLCFCFILLPQSPSQASTGCHIFTTLFIHPHASFLPIASLFVSPPEMPGGLSLTSALWLTGGPAEAQHSKGISGNTDISNPWLLKALRLLSSSVWQLNRREIRNKNTPLLFTLKAPER